MRGLIDGSCCQLWRAQQRSLSVELLDVPIRGAVMLAHLQSASLKQQINRVNIQRGGGQNNRNTRSCGSPPLRRRYVISCVNLAIKALNTVLLVIKSLSGAETRSCIYSDKAEFTLRPSHLTREAAGALRRDVSRVGVQLEFTESAHSKPNQIQFSSHSITTHK